MPLKMFYYFSTYCGQTTKETGFLQSCHSVISYSREIFASIEFVRSTKTHYQHNIKILNWVMFGSCLLKDTRFVNLFSWLQEILNSDFVMAFIFIRLISSMEITNSCFKTIKWWPSRYKSHKDRNVPLQKKIIKATSLAIYG